MADRFDDAFVERLIAATAERDVVPGFDAVVGFTIGKTQQAVVEIESGRVVRGLDRETEAGISLVFTGAKADQWMAGEFGLAVAYMKGDFKPVGSTGDLAAALEVLDDPAVIAKL